MSYTGTVVVIPTRNRAVIAMNALRSVLHQAAERIHVLVSDNSTLPLDRERLESFCSALGDERVRYVTPPRSLPMPDHWNWAIHEALRFDAGSHFLYLTDRMMFRRGALQEVLSLAALYPRQVISYHHDRIIDDARPIRIEQYPATGRLLEVQSEHFLWLFSRAILHPGLPRMLNCIVPREVLVRLDRRFGAVFSSIAPDFNFCCRCLDVEASILFFDKAPIFHYALDRSHGASVTRGELTPDNVDFTAHLTVDHATRNYATPIPRLNTAVNAAFHEYCLFRQTSRSAKFAEVDLPAYLAANAAELTQVLDPALRAEMLALLVAKGYREAKPRLGLASLRPTNLRRLWTTRRHTLGAAITRRVRRPAGPSFAALDEAIHYLEQVSPGNLVEDGCTAALLKARERPTR